jgi:predicted deacylase
VCDLHSGGSSLMYVPSALMSGYRRDADMSTQLATLKAFSAPLAYVSESNIGEDRTTSGAGARQGVPTIGTELGGSGHVTRAALRIAERGVNNLLVHLGILPERDRIAPDGPSRILEVGGPDYFVYTPDNGLYEPLVEIGDTVSAGQPAARIHFPETPWAEPVTAHFARDGFVLCKRMPGRTMRGDCLFHLGTDLAA